ncbi:Pre-B-cell leukemia transcription factor 1 [Planoprotostelium fungivorum]|uniref:Pre-B-cell leukemia transcription factor 1 n=1 Tax=Planoprotostelium fungivorum TaxID=1890364 RepID=A0A2P6MZS8_9EUKA|nr:Pre-B-cell leukemia transcription factor 1 [Planoprotostelium fungivorum]
MGNLGSPWLFLSETMFSLDVVFQIFLTQVITSINDHWHHLHLNNSPGNKEMEAEDDLSQVLQNLMTTLWQGIVTTEDFKVDSQPVLNESLNQIVEHLQQLDDIRSKFDHINIPLEVLQCIDEGKNPDTFSLQILERCKTQNEKTRGKIRQLRNFKESLLEEMNKQLPGFDQMAESLGMTEEEEPLEEIRSMKPKFVKPEHRTIVHSLSSSCSETPYRVTSRLDTSNRATSSEKPHKSNRGTLTMLETSLASLATIADFIDSDEGVLKMTLPNRIGYDRPDPHGTANSHVHSIGPLPSALDHLGVPLLGGVRASALTSIPTMQSPPPFFNQGPPELSRFMSYPPPYDSGVPPVYMPPSVPHTSSLFPFDHPLSSAHHHPIASPPPSIPRFETPPTMGNKRDYNGDKISADPLSSTEINNLSGGSVELLTHDQRMQRSLTRTHRLLQPINSIVLALKKENAMPLPTADPQDYTENNFGLEVFLAAQGINPEMSKMDKANMSEEERTEFIAELDSIKFRYGKELERLTQLCNEFTNRTLKEMVRVITEQETNLRVLAIKQKFDYVRNQLRQQVYNNIISLAKNYNQIKPKRRTLPKKASEMLSEWFYAHLNDPYPSEEEKIMMAAHIGITLTQLNNWFGNKRIRYKRRCLDAEKAGNMSAEELRAFRKAEEEHDRGLID